LDAILVFNSYLFFFALPKKNQRNP